MAEAVRRHVFALRLAFEVVLSAPAVVLVPLALVAGLDCLRLRLSVRLLSRLQLRELLMRRVLLLRDGLSLSLRDPKLRRLHLLLLLDEGGSRGVLTLAGSLRSTRNARRRVGDVLQARRTVAAGRTGAPCRSARRAGGANVAIARRQPVLTWGRVGWQKRNSPSRSALCCGDIASVTSGLSALRHRRKEEAHCRLVLEYPLE